MQGVERPNGRNSLPSRGATEMRQSGDALHSVQLEERMETPIRGYNPEQLTSALDLVEQRKAALEVLRPILGVAELQHLRTEIACAFLRGR